MSVLRARLGAQLLAGERAADPGAVVERLLAVQGQDERGFRLAIRARSDGLSAADVERALDERALVVAWLNRGTLHLTRSEDYGWLHALTTSKLERSMARALKSVGLDSRDVEKGIAAIERALADDGPLPREALRERIAAAGVPAEGQATFYLLFVAGARGLVVRGPILDGEHCHALTRDWLGPQAPVEREPAMAELARRYLAGHGPAGERDLARWAGIGLREARAGLAAIASELTDVGGGLADLAARESAEELPSPLLLGPFDPSLHGWSDRTPITGAHTEIVTTNGIFRAFAMVDGRAVALWRLRGGEITIEPFGELGPTVAAALDEQAADVRRFLGL